MARFDDMKSQLENGLPRDISEEVTVTNPNHLVDWVRQNLKQNNIKTRQVLFVDSKNGAAAAMMSNGSDSGSNLSSRRGAQAPNAKNVCYLCLRPSQKWVDLNWISNTQQDWFDIIQTLYLLRASFLPNELMSPKKPSASVGSADKKSVHEIMPLEFYTAASRAKSASEADFLNLIESGNPPKSPMILTMRVPVFETSDPTIVYLLLRPNKDGTISARLLDDEPAFMQSSKSQLEIIKQELKNSFTAVDSDLSTILRRIQNN